MLTVLGKCSLERIKKLGEIQYLNLEGTHITDECISSLKRLKKLESLRLEGTGLTARGLKELERAFPAARIFKD